MKTLTAENVLSDLQKHAESIKSGESQTVGTASLGDVVRQGDLYLTVIEVLPPSAKKVKEKQLAPGTTQGSRHVASAQLYEVDKREIAEAIVKANLKASMDVERFVGPVVVFDKASPVTHPEHGWVTMPAGSVCAVTYQRNLDQEEKERRVQD